MSDMDQTTITLDASILFSPEGIPAGGIDVMSRALDNEAFLLREKAAKAAHAVQTSGSGRSATPYLAQRYEDRATILLKAAAQLRRLEAAGHKAGCTDLDGYLNPGEQG